MNNIIRLTGFRNDLDKLLTQFQDSSDGMFLSVDNESKLKQLVLEIRDTLDEEFGENNEYSMDVYYTYNTEIGGFSLGPTYKCISDLIAVVNASITKIDNRKQNMINLNSSESWQIINKEFGVTKRAFGKKINFISDIYKRKIIFRDIANAHYFAYNGFYKSSVILAGSVIEEILRLYLIFKGIKPKDNNFYSYIEACRDNRLLIKGLPQLSHSARHFRNIVHLSNENNKNESMEKSNAVNAVSSIFIIFNDL